MSMSSAEEGTLKGMLMPAAFINWLALM